VVIDNMTTESHFQSLGLSIEYGTNPAIGTVNILGDMQNEVVSYNHTISAFMGFDKATCELLVPRIKMEDWLINGLGRYIRVHDSSLTVVWEGFVDQISYSVGGISISVGPLLDITNRVSAVFSDIAPSAGNVSGTTDVTLIQEDADSQAEYGIIEGVINAGSMFRDEADQICSVYLADKKYPPKSLNLNIASMQNPSIRLSCRGFGYWLDAYIYEDLTDAVVASSTKVSDVIDADPNSIILNKDISSNASLAYALENQNRSGLTVIKACVNLGDGSDNRWLFGVYENRTAVFEVIPNEIEYIYEVIDEKQTISGRGNKLIKPWNVRAGKWIEARDIPLSQSPRPESYDLRYDIRSAFIESVTYTMPYSINISSANVGKADQAIAKYGIGALVGTKN